MQENVLFGRRYDEKRYAAVLRACALEGERTGRGQRPFLAFVRSL